MFKLNGSFRIGSRLLKLAVPAGFWLLTAAPSFVDPQLYDGFNNVAYAAPQPQGAGSAGSLFDRQAYRPVIDTAVGEIYTALSQNQLDRALTIANRLIKEFPNFHLAYLLRGDILSLKAGRPIQRIGDMPSVPKGKEDELRDLREEAIARFRAVEDRPQRNMLPSELVEIGDEVKYVVLVDTSRSRLYLYENTFPQPRLVTDFYITQGKMGAVKSVEGDKRTPIGVYTVTTLLPKAKLTDFYGPIALPINYPNAWDKRQGRTGTGIWLHGMPASYVSRPPLDSDGCVVLANNDLLALKKFIDIGNTPVVITKKLDFIPTEVWKAQRKAALRMVQTWKEDLESNLQAGLTHYASNVLIDGKDLIDWQKDKHLGSRSFGKIKVQDLTVMKYPSDKDMLFVSFKQEDKVYGAVKKEQYWMKMGTHWRIVQEDTAKL
ncbi:MAG TPA: L,D-transpeptidase family protein [Limnobacter sp.]|uniref:L,D-transpeptidase family protein n=1 Tax=Limnobacter sp. TaxID=2003368 RepID=UPI002E33AB34|nr:L,D-transpeptidase family protein [Limnobacter sp.]HEX5487355.1 L,D-transpeptidase family protein [Limnobacter sp.]